ncbi:Piwi-domain-containing protein [Cylindrobasidium torrendii FP15055 ss-10]|uniref:Piwi-domain-containing protein n=1 Tax=Cylindrobasidium torrendii FP15055 ss-10 TaxID=1314674 RepID=A0A0D7BMK5_9AGAR|nr:Piwi-domain-containing protein [Cylindrobasidium torrendii FP15055 ss-10]
MPPRGDRGRGAGGPARGGGGDRGRGGGPDRGRGGAPRGGAGGGPPRGGAGGGGGRGAPVSFVGRGRGGGPSAGTGAGRGAALPPLPSGVQAIGVPRTEHGSQGRVMPVLVNAMWLNLPDTTIYHYDAAFEGDKSFRPKFNREIIEALRANNTNIFSQPPIYDGRANLYMVANLPLTGKDKSTKQPQQVFDVPISKPAPPGGAARPPKIHRVKLTLVRVNDAESLLRYLNRSMSWNENVATVIASLNVAINSLAAQTHPSRGRSVYPLGGESRLIGQGLEVVRGFFQSIRPTPGRLMVNVDVSIGVMYRKGPLIGTCLDFLGLQQNSDVMRSPLVPNQRNVRERNSLSKFLSGVQVRARSANGGFQTVSIYKLTDRGANQLTFNDNNNQPVTVADYFRRNNAPLKFPTMICIQTKKGMQIPLERCDVEPGQLCRMQLTPDAQSQVVSFSTQRPEDRLNTIKRASQVYNYTQSHYVQSLGLNVDTASFPITTQARVLDPPRMVYSGKQAQVQPRGGTWNMIDKMFIQAQPIFGWMLVILETRFWNDNNTAMMWKDFVKGAKAVGIRFNVEEPLVATINPHSVALANLGQAIATRAMDFRKKHNAMPSLVVCILPENNNIDIYRAIKNWGDIKMGVITQCLKQKKASGAKPQYWANVMLKVNAKLGGINAVPDALSAIADTANPTIFMGADVMHPGPGSDKPSYAAVVGSLDTAGARYMSQTNLQPGRIEMIQDLEAMATVILENAREYRLKAEPNKSNTPWRRLVFFRDGVSEGEFAQVLEQELPMLQAAARNAKLDVKITFVIVGKRHHLRFFPTTNNDADRSGNLPPGTVIDRDIISPLEFDYYLQSHAGLLGTSRPSHYIVVHDENRFSADAIQAISYKLCYVYARATRSVSIPAPVYYAHIVCSRAETHYGPDDASQYAPSVAGTSTTDKSAARRQAFDSHAQRYQRVNKNQATKMYFM